MARRRSIVVLAVVLLITSAACGSDDSPSIESAPTSNTTAPPAGEDGTKIVIKDFAFSPAELKVQVGDTVTVANEDGATHTWSADDHSFENELAPGAMASHQFEKAGTVSYHCDIHSNMKGTVVVS